MKKALSLALTLVMCLGLTIPAFAETQTLYLNGYSGDNTETAESTPAFAQLSLKGDLLQKETAVLYEFSDSTSEYPCPSYTFSGPVEVEVMQGMLQWSIDSVGIDLVDIDTYSITQANVQFFDGIYDYEDKDGQKHEISIEEVDSSAVGEDFWENLDSLLTIRAGATAVLTEPGSYAVHMRYHTIEGICIAFVTITEPTSTEPEPTTPTVTVENIPASGTAVASTQTVTVDGKKVEFQMYALVDANGNGTNYIKLRDMAQVLNGTKAQFSVGYDGTISVTSGQAYASTGTEMTTPFSGNRSYTGGAQSIKVNGSAIDMTAITLLDDAGGGYNYFKLRDLGAALGFNVGWSAENGVFIESDKPYAG